MTNLAISRTGVWAKRIGSLISGQAKPLWGLDALTRKIAEKTFPRTLAKSAFHPRYQDNWKGTCAVLQKIGLIDGEGMIPEKISHKSLGKLKNMLYKTDFDQNKNGGFGNADAYNIFETFLSYTRNQNIKIDLDFDRGLAEDITISPEICQALSRAGISQLSLHVDSTLNLSRTIASLKYALRYLATKGLPADKTVKLRFPSIDGRSHDSFTASFGSALTIKSLSPAHCELTLVRTIID